MFAVITLWRHRPLQPWALVVALLLGLVSVLQPTWLVPFQKAWFKLGLWLAAIVNPVVTAVLSVFAITPSALLRRARGADPLPLRFDPLAGSYWTPRQPLGPAPETMSRQF